YTPEEYGAEARRAVEEGASMIHIHARTPGGAPSFEVEEYRAIAEAIRSETDDVIINFSTGAVGVPVAKRVAYLRECRPEVAALNMGSMNYAKYSRSRRDFVFKMVFANPFEEIIELLAAMNELSIKPEHECFDLGHVGSLWPLIDMGVLKEPVHVDCIMGVLGGIPPSARNLAAMVQNIPGVGEGGEGGVQSSMHRAHARAHTHTRAVHPENDPPDEDVPEGPALSATGRDRSHWSVIGISREQWMLVAAALTLGGSVRVGLEDNLYLPDGSMARSNGDLIAKARTMAEDVGRRPATVSEARALLGIAP
ncbi:MAG: beta-keto acid cleavage family enzyme, partial [Solirubrobacteraceae bacterium]